MTGASFSSDDKKRNFDATGQKGILLLEGVVGLVIAIVLLLAIPASYIMKLMQERIATQLPTAEITLPVAKEENKQGDR